MISNAANQHTTKRAIRKNIDPHAHAATSRDAQKLARYRPKLNTRNLLVDLNQAQIEQRNVVKLFEYHCGSDAPRRQYWYEDLIDATSTLGQRICLACFMAQNPSTSRSIVSAAVSRQGGLGWF